MGDSIHHAQAIIANGASQSSVIDLRASCIAAVLVPSTWTDASITFAASDTADGTFGQVYDVAGNAYTLVNGTKTDSRFILDTAITYGLAFVKLVSGTVSAGVNQGGARTLKVALVPGPD